MSSIWLEMVTTAAPRLPRRGVLPAGRRGVFFPLCGVVGVLGAFFAATLGVLGAWCALGVEGVGGTLGVWDALGIFLFTVYEFLKYARMGG